MGLVFLSLKLNWFWLLFLVEVIIGCWFPEDQRAVRHRVGMNNARSRCLRLMGLGILWYIKLVVGFPKIAEP